MYEALNIPNDALLNQLTQNKTPIRNIVNVINLQKKIIRLLLCKKRIILSGDKVIDDFIRYTQTNRPNKSDICSL
jgi:hypothetical protein